MASLESSSSSFLCEGKAQSCDFNRDWVRRDWTGETTENCEARVRPEINLLKFEVLLKNSTKKFLLVKTTLVAFKYET